MAKEDNEVAVKDREKILAAEAIQRKHDRLRRPDFGLSLLLSNCCFDSWNSLSSIDQIVAVIVVVVVVEVVVVVVLVVVVVVVVVVVIVVVVVVVVIVVFLFLLFSCSCCCCFTFLYFLFFSCSCFCSSSSSLRKVTLRLNTCCCFKSAVLPGVARL